jgi:hypothetical protein
VRNSLLVEDSCADNERDLSVLPKQRVYQGESKKEKGKSGKRFLLRFHPKEKNRQRGSEPKARRKLVFLLPFSFLLSP